MGIFGSKDTAPTAADAEDTSFGGRIALKAIHRMLATGINGVGPLDSAQEVVSRARSEHSDPEKAIDEVTSDHVRLAAGGGFITGVGGLVTMPVSLPGNVIGFYVLASRMVASVATLRGYDVDDEDTRTALVLTLMGADGDEVLRKAGVAGGGRMAQIALNRVPRAAAMVINKGVGFRVATQLGARFLGRLGRAVPLAGGVIGAGLDGYLMSRLADHARHEFPARESLEG